MQQGSIKWFNESKGFGFISRESQNDLFVHKSNIEGSLKEGDKVEFDEETGPKGPAAINVKKIE